MKKLLMIAAVTFASASAFATKARLSSLSYPYSRQLTDVQTIFVNPSDLTLMGSWVTFETGSSNLAGTVAVTAPTAEAGFARAVGDARWGFYLGHTGTSAVHGSGSLDFPMGATNLRPAGFLMEENPLNLMYAAKVNDMSWGLGLNYSNTDRKTAGKQSAMGATLGARMGFWDASLDLDITDTAENTAATTKWTGKMGADLRVGYVMDAWYFYGQYAMGGGKVENTTTAATTVDKDNSLIGLGAINTTKSEGGEFFYGVAVEMAKQDEKVAGPKVETTRLPVVIGIEADAASWLVLRGSITQTVLLNSRNSTPVGGAAATNGTGGNNTRVAAGTGIKFNKFMLDTTLAAETNGNINGANLLANAGLVYNF